MGGRTKELLPVLLFLAFVSSCHGNIERILVNDTTRFGNDEVWPPFFGGDQQNLNTAAVCDGNLLLFFTFT